MVLLELEKSGLDEVKEIIFQMAKLKNRLKELGVVKTGEEITSDYAKWFCCVKFGLEPCNKSMSGYHALSKFGKRIVIKSKLRSDIDFKTNFDEIQVDEFDYLQIVFMNNETWMIESIYQLSNDDVRGFLDFNQADRLKWGREARSLSLQLYPDEENTLTPII